MNTLAFSLVLLAGTAPAQAEAPTTYDDYVAAFHAAREAQRPLLVILNPPADSPDRQVSIDHLQSSPVNSGLLEDYVVAVLDTGTEPGRKYHEAFGAPELPRLIVTDKRQQTQLYRTSRPLTAAMWTSVLRTYRNGIRPTLVQPVSRSQAGAAVPPQAVAPAAPQGYGQPTFRPAWQPMRAFRMPSAAFCAT